MESYLLICTSSWLLYFTILASGRCGALGIYSFLNGDFCSVFFIIVPEVWEIVHNKKIWQLHDSLGWVSSQDIMMAHQELSVYIACTVDFRWWKTVWRPQSLKIPGFGKLFPEDTMTIKQQNCEHPINLEVSDSVKTFRLNQHSRKGQPGSST